MLIVAGLVTLLYGVYQKSTDPTFTFFKSERGGPAVATEVPLVPAGRQPALPRNVSIAVPKGSRIETVQANGTRLVVRVATPGQPGLILILDADSGAVVRRIRLEPMP